MKYAQALAKENVSAEDWDALGRFAAFQNQMALTLEFVKLKRELRRLEQETAEGNQIAINVR